MLSSIVSLLETICKYQLEKDEVREDGSVRWNALIPAKDGARSVFRISGVPETEIWDIGLNKVAAPRGLPLLGRIELSSAVVYDQKLQFVPDRDPASRHADIVGWPDEKEKRRSIAQVLAAEASRVPYSGPSNSAEL